MGNIDLSGNKLYSGNVHGFSEAMLYECYNENNPYDNEQIKADFNELYQQMNGMPLREMDNIVYPVCKLCRDHEWAGFVEGVKVGFRLECELVD